MDVAAASAQGVLVTRATPGFIPAVAELVLGQMVDLARGISAATERYHRGEAPEARIGRQLEGSTLGVIGYGAIGRRLAEMALALNMRVLVVRPARARRGRARRPGGARASCWRGPISSSASPWRRPRPRT